VPDARRRFEEYFLPRVETDPPFRSAVLNLRGEKMGCFCGPTGWCHARFVAAWIDRRPIVRRVL
jgi:hypothetical protein